MDRSLEVIAACMALPIVERQIDRLQKSLENLGMNAIADGIRAEANVPLSNLRRRQSQLLTLICQEDPS